MSEREGRTSANESLSTKMTRGCAFLIEEEAKLLRLRSRKRHKTVSSTIQELVQPVIDRFEATSPEEQKRLLQRYTEQLVNRSEIGLKAVEEGAPPPFVEVHWALPRTFIDRVGIIAAQGRLSNDSFMSCVLSDAINMRDNS